LDGAAERAGDLLSADMVTICDTGRDLPKTLDIEGALEVNAALQGWEDE